MIVFMNYFAYEVNINYQVVSESPTEFPAITICNLNPFDVATENTTGAYINKMVRKLYKTLQMYC